MGLDIVVPEHAEVISAIGDALSLIRVERERTFNAPTAADTQALIAEMEAEAIRAGAGATTLDVRVEQIAERGAVRVTVTGAVGLDSGALPGPASRPPRPRSRPPRRRGATTTRRRSASTGSPPASTAAAASRSSTTTATSSSTSRARR